MKKLNKNEKKNNRISRRAKARKDPTLNESPLDRAIRYGYK